MCSTRKAPPEDAQDSDSTTLLERISAHARLNPDQVAVRFVEDSAGTLCTLTWAELWKRSISARGVFEARGLGRGDRLVLMLPTTPEYLSGLLGALLGGLTPTTLAPASRFHETASARDEWRQIVEAFAPAAIVSDTVPSGLDLPRIAPQELAAHDAPPELPPVVSPDIACVQFSSGSTGRPRGIALGWPAIHANVHGMARRVSLEPGAEVCSWLPMYHDMGLFGMLFTSLYYGCPITLIDSGLFVVNPKIWLRALSDFRTRITVAPPSAMHYTLQLLSKRPMQGLDLSALEIMFCGAEPIPPALLDEFEETMSGYGASRRIFTPVYGLAEATLAVTIPYPAHPPSVDAIDRRGVESRAVAKPSAGESEALGVVGVGVPIDGVEVRILGEDGTPLGERGIGRIVVRSPSLMTGTLEAGHLSVRTGDWLDTGDLGYFAEGELFVTGRLKDIIIKGGRNYSADRLEEVAAMTEGVSRAAAFGVYDDRRMTEHVVIMTEAAPKLLKDEEARDRLRLAVRAMLTSADYPADEVVLVARGALPRTTSGKIRRQECREIYRKQRESK